MFTPFAFVKQAAAGGGPAYGTLTTAFIAAAGITGSVIPTALNNFETGLTTYSLTSKIMACYPFVGGNATTSKYNFMDTTLYPLSYTGSITFNMDGMNIASSAAEAHASSFPGNLVSHQVGHDATYIKTKNQNGVVPCTSGLKSDLTPATGSLTQYYMEFSSATNTFTAFWPCNVATNQGDGSLGVSSGGVPGTWVVARTSASSLKIYKNGSSLGENTTTLTGRSYGPYSVDVMYIAGRQNNFETTAAFQFGFKSFGFGTYGGMDATDVSNYTTLIAALQTDLGR